MNTRVKFEYNKKNNIWFIIMLLLAIVMYVNVEIHMIAVVGYLLLYYLIISLSIEPDERYPWLWALILFTLGAVFTAFSVQYLILEPENFSRTADFMLFQCAVCVCSVPDCAAIHWQCDADLYHQPYFTFVLWICQLLCLSFPGK